MSNINQKVIDSLIKLLTQFIERKTGTFSIKNRSNAELVHYYYEILRYWNKINFILKRKLKFSKNSHVSNRYSIAKYLIAIYRIVWEKENVIKVGKELKFIEAELNLIKNLKSFSWEQTLIGVKEIERLSLEIAIPTFLINKLATVMDLETIRANIKSMDGRERKERLYFRFNDLLFDKNLQDSLDFFLQNLKEQGIKAKLDTHFSNIFYTTLKNKKKILLNRFYKEGKLVIQDKASFAVAQLLEPQANELICDICAAPGIKTSIIAQLSQNQAIVIANDFNRSRVSVMKPLLRKLNVSNTNLLNSDGIKLPIRFTNFFDKILLDAPCTGSGTFSTNPELKWRQNEGFLHQNLVLQEKLLKSATNLLKPSGILVYSTCSLYPEEGEYQVLKILNHFKPMELPEWISPSYKIDLQHIPGTGRFFPAIHQTKGFFIAKFKKK
ncbi:MAG: RsmB/NOP family class I SAM-dependent RNA methyltransferase [Candidatus Lokiarchaeota archaeon]|nr:RsmB/NOP family class I SAM-dependent RNA methyltransferase [Candidatus Lokiarchaeota archaeon]